MRVVGSSAAELETLLRELSRIATEQRGELGALSASLRRSAEGMERAATAPELERVLLHADSMALRLDRTAASLEGAAGSAQAVMAGVAQGEGTLGRMATDAVLYENLARSTAQLDRTLASLDRLIRDVQKNPKRYVSIRIF